MTAPERPPATRTLLQLSAVILGALGLPLLFAPAETAGAFGWAGETAASLAGSGMLAMAILDWTGRGAVYGGIFGRPIILANLVLGVTGGLTLVRVQLGVGAGHPLGWIPALGLVLHGIAFGWLLVRATPTSTSR